MAKKKVVTENTTGLSAEEFANLSDEQKLAAFNKLAEDKAALEAAKQEADDEFPSMEVDADEENDIEGGTYVFPFKAFIYDDGRTFSVKKLIADSAGSGKPAEEAQAILAKLVIRGSAKKVIA